MEGVGALIEWAAAAGEASAVVEAGAAVEGAVAAEEAAVVGGEAAAEAEAASAAGEAAAAGNPLRFSPDQSALVDLAKQAGRTGVTPGEADILRQWADEVGLPFRGPEVHPGRPFGQYPHIHLGPVDHIPVN